MLFTVVCLGADYVGVYPSMLRPRTLLIHIMSQGYGLRLVQRGILSFLYFFSCVCALKSL